MPLEQLPNTPPQPVTTTVSWNPVTPSHTPVDGETLPENDTFVLISYRNNSEAAEVWCCSFAEGKFQVYQPERIHAWANLPDPAPLPVA